MKQVTIAITALITCAVLSTGCSTIPEDNQRMIVGLNEDIHQIYDDMVAIEGRMESIEMAQDDLHRDLSASQAEDSEHFDSLAARLSKLDHGIASMGERVQKDRKEIVDHLTKQLTEVVNSQKPSSTTVNEYGYEHVVKKGDTLSEIAKQYGTKQDVIMKANNVTNPNMLRVGDTLFVPAR